MPETREFQDLDAWLDACRAAGVRGVAVQRVDEIRPALHGVSGVTVGLVSYATLVGYADGVVFRARVADLDRGAEGRLAAEGFRVRSASHNLG